VYSHESARKRSNLSHILAVISQQVSFVQEGDVDIAQLDELEGGALSRLEEKLLIVVISTK
jgi:hypothetical protein